MRFRFCAPYWEVEGPHGWRGLPHGTRPSDVVTQRSDAFTARLLPMRRVEDDARCDTAAEYEAALARRVAVRVAQEFGRSVDQLQGRRRLPALMRMRRVFAVASEDLGVGLPLMADFLDRSLEIVARYAADGRTDMVSDRALRRACDAVVDGEFESEHCESNPHPGVELGGPRASTEAAS